MWWGGEGERKGIMKIRIVDNNNMKAREWIIII